jgi:hypothetical protein|tara:strand:+ start:684 stop:866 length:183 start_codon:yes stop_codon:yes gene_type:complete
MTLINKLKTLESLMKEVSLDMRHDSAVNSPMYAHSYELIGAAVTVRTWIDGLEEENNERN